MNAFLKQCLCLNELTKIIIEYRKRKIHNGINLTHIYSITKYQYKKCIHLLKFNYLPLFNNNYLNLNNVIYCL